MSFDLNDPKTWPAQQGQTPEDQQEALNNLRSWLEGWHQHVLEILNQDTPK